MGDVLSGAALGLSNPAGGFSALQRQAAQRLHAEQLKAQQDAQQLQRQQFSGLLQSTLGLTPEQAQELQAFSPSQQAQFGSIVAQQEARELAETRKIKKEEEERRGLEERRTSLQNRLNKLDLPVQEAQVLQQSIQTTPNLNTVESQIQGLEADPLGISNIRAVLPDASSKSIRSYVDRIMLENKQFSRLTGDARTTVAAELERQISSRLKGPRNFFTSPFTKETVIMRNPETGEEREVGASDRKEIGALRSKNFRLIDRSVLQESPQPQAPAPSPAQPTSGLRPGERLFIHPQTQDRRLVSSDSDARILQSQGYTEVNVRVSR